MKTIANNNILSSIFVVIVMIFSTSASAQTKIENGNRCWTIGASAIYDPQNNGWGGQIELNRHILYGGRINVDWLITAGGVQDDILKHRLHGMAGVKLNLNANPHHMVRVGIKALVGGQEQMTGCPSGAKMSGINDAAAFDAWLASANWSGKLRLAAEAGVDLNFKFSQSSRVEFIASFTMQYRPYEGKIEGYDQTLDFSGSAYLEQMTPEELDAVFKDAAQDISKKFVPRVTLGFRFRL